MKAPNRRSRVLDENGTILASSEPGEVGRKAQTNHRTQTTEEEVLLPVGVGKKIQANEQESEESLLPLGMNK